MVKETDIQRAVCDYLALKKYFFWRNNNIPMYNTQLKRFRAMPKYAMKGVPDIILIKNGIFIGLEIKKKGNYLSLDQKKFEQLCKDNNAQYHLIRSLEDLQKIGL